ncbi:MAG: hypothetical protein LJE95_16035 [Acidobacteria bacterium]|nr:hypothetical protein [Acidobacteriota bacterium]
MREGRFWCLTGLMICVALSCAGVSRASEAKPEVKGTLTANGVTVELPYVYVYKEKKGFYDENDPTWKVIFVGKPIGERELDEHIWGAAYVEIGITKTAEFGDKPELQVYSQSLRLSADSGGNISGGTYPKLEIESTGPERFAGRIYHAEPQKIFDDTFQYDFRFSAPLSNPEAPLGAALPADGGEPGKAYLAWIAAIHAGDLDRLKQLVPAEMASQMEGDDAKDQLELMQLMTPTEVKILGGSSDGKTAILQVEGVMDGAKNRGEVTLEKKGDHWLPTKSSWK